jgi:hypothetical protein
MRALSENGSPFTGAVGRTENSSSRAREPLHRGSPPPSRTGEASRGASPPSCCRVRIIHRAGQTRHDAPSVRVPILGRCRCVNSGSTSSSATTTNPLLERIRRIARSASTGRDMSWSASKIVTRSYPPERRRVEASLTKNVTRSATPVSSRALHDPIQGQERGDREFHGLLLVSHQRLASTSRINCPASTITPTQTARRRGTNRRRTKTPRIARSRLL